MLFKDNFYTIINTKVEEDTHTFSIQLNATHEIFKGHFPDNPVTPGVVQMEIIKELSSIILHRTVELKTMGNCKFLAILNPVENAAIDIELKINETDDNNQRVTAVIKNANGNFLKMSAEYAIS